MPVKEVVYIAIKMDEEDPSPVVGLYESLEEVLEEIENFDDDYKKNIWIDHREDGYSVRVLKPDSGTGEYGSYFDDNYIPPEEDF